MGLTGGQAAAVGLSLAGGALQAGAQDQASRIAQEQNKQNQKLNRLEFENTIQRGEEDAAQVVVAERQVRGQQLVSAAGQGVDVASQVVQDFQVDAKVARIEAERTLRHNARLAAFGLKTEMSGLKLEQESLQASRNSALAGTILGTGAQVANVFIGK